MSTKFTEYKGLDLPTVASEVLDFWKKENIFEKSVTTREGNKPFVFFNIEQQRQQKRDEQQEKRELFLEKKAVQQLRVDMIKSNVLQYQMKRANQVRQLHVSAEQMVEMERTRLEDLNRMRANKIKQNEVQMLNYKHDLMQRKIDNNDYK